METHTLLSLGAFTSYDGRVSALVRPKSVVNGCFAEKVFATAKNNEHRPTKIFIPNLLARWPWPRRINPYYAAVKKESAAWTMSFSPFSPKAQHAFDCCNFSLVACLGYPTAEKEQARSGCDLMNLFFVVDEYSDVSEPSEVRKQKDAIMDALQNPHKLRPKGEWFGGEMARQFWERTTRNASEGCQKRFILAIDRSGHRIRDIDSYFNVRRKRTLASMNMMTITNDIVSYNVEQYRGDDSHNMLSVVMNEFGTDVNSAILWAQDLHTKSEQKFHAAMAVLPEWGEPLNSQVKEYCDGLGNWVRANYDWGFESGRYFGDRGLEIKEEGWMDLMPKKRKNGAGEVQNPSWLTVPCCDRV